MVSDFQLCRKLIFLHRVDASRQIAAIIGFACERLFCQIVTNVYDIDLEYINHIYRKIYLKAPFENLAMMLSCVFSQKFTFWNYIHMHCSRKYFKASKKNFSENVSHIKC